MSRNIFHVSNENTIYECPLCRLYVLNLIFPVPIIELTESDVKFHSDQIANIDGKIAGFVSAGLAIYRDDVQSLKKLLEKGELFL